MKKCPKCRYPATTRMVIECSEGGTVDVSMCKPCAEAFVERARRAGKLLGIQKFSGSPGVA